MNLAFVRARQYEVVAGQPPEEFVSLWFMESVLE